jgi:hypothetical protein
MSVSTMTVRRAAALALLSWALVVTEPTPRTINAGFPTKEACEKAATDWQTSYRKQLKYENTKNWPNRRRRLARAVPPTKCVEDREASPAPL